MLAKTIRGVAVFISMPMSLGGECLQARCYGGGSCADVRPAYLAQRMIPTVPRAVIYGRKFAVTECTPNTERRLPLDDCR